ncbi:MAG: ATP-binding cassette domain-containing protein, partial [Xanthobacteraceae bacterium]|nr:ATP-binding cassette domain-containing protein [Xanthobacteraceae bacterium]
AYPLKLMGLPKAERTRRVEQLVAHLDVKIDLNLYPYHLSGGQQQLVSIMRALVVEPEILFLDEPFSALDYEMTLFMRAQLQRIFMETATTTILVSHDLEEAVYLADLILLLSRRPARVADFVAYTAPRPRTDATLSEPEFVRVKAHCLEVFQREVRKG